MKILLIKFRHIGDVLLTEPMISTLAAQGAQVYLLVKPGTAALLAAHPALTELCILPQRQPEESRLRFVWRYLQFIGYLRHLHFDVSINTTTGDHGLILAFLSGIKQRIGVGKTVDKWWRQRLLTEPLIPSSERLHTVQRNLALIAPICPIPEQISVQLPITDEIMAHCRQKLLQLGWQAHRPLIQVHPVSRWFFKCWRADYVAHCLDYLQQHFDCQIAITAAPDPRELAWVQGLKQQLQSPVIDLSGQLSLPETAALARLSVLFFGVDSAPMHMAAAVNTPVVALFGPSGTSDWGPWPNGSSSTVNPYQQRNSFQAAGSHCVIQQDWQCAPCGKAGCDDAKKSRCLDELMPEQVVDVLVKQLHSIGCNKR